MQKDLSSDLPEEFELAQNYLNPSNPAPIMISFNLSKSSNVTLRIYSLLDQEVGTLADHVMEAGGHSIPRDGKDNFEKSASSGVCFYRINAGGFSIVKKMIFMR